MSAAKVTMCVIGKAPDQWAYEKKIELRLIQAGKPTQNAYAESFNGKFPDECLDAHWLRCNSSP